MAITIDGIASPKLNAVPATTYSFNTTLAGSAYLWEIVSQPPGGPDAFSSTTIANPVLLVRKEGTYLIRLTRTTGAGTVQETAVLAVPSITSGLRVPAYAEVLEAGATGWDQGAGNGP